MGPPGCLSSSPPRPRLEVVARTTAAIAALSVVVSGVGARWEPPLANARFDYQIGGDYRLAARVSVVSRDWFAGRDAPGDRYTICYVNTFQTQDDERGVDRPDERSNWPRWLVLFSLGDDPNWGGEYLIDLRSPAKRVAALRHVRPMVDRSRRRVSRPSSTTTSTRGRASTAPPGRPMFRSDGGRRSPTPSC